MKFFIVIVFIFVVMVVVVFVVVFVSIEVDKCVFVFDINVFNGFKGFNQVNFNYFFNINFLQIGFFGNFVNVNNFNIL